MFKKVDIIPNGPIFALKVAITGPVIGMQMSTGDILRCIYSRASVTEILEDGTRVKLDLTNYDKDNAKKKVEVVNVEEPKIVITEVNSANTQASTVEETKVDVTVETEADPKVDAVAETKVEAEPEVVITETAIPTEPKEDVKSEEVVKDTVVSQNADKRYFNENEKQKNKVKNK